MDEDISCIDEDMLLLNSPSPPSNHPAARASNSKSKKRKAISTPPKASTKKATLISPSVLGISDIDDELEIIEADNDEIEEITGINDVTVSSGSYLEDEEEDLDDEVDEGLFEFGESDEESDEDIGALLDGKINIFHCHGSFFVWNADDVLMLREECRIVGKLTGSLPRAPRQNSHLGIPLQLMPEEVKLLVDIEAAVVVTEEPPSEKVLGIREAAIQNVRATNLKIQQQLFKETRQEDVKKRMNDIIAGKKAKKQKPKKGATNIEVATNAADVKLDSRNVVEKQMKTASGQDDNDHVTEEKDSENKTEYVGGDDLTVDDIISETADTSEKHCLVQIFTENPWKRTIRPYFDWAYPSTEREVLRYHVFKDLWGKGFFLTSGVKFGGDFLVYPGDPARYHSHYIAVCKSQAEALPSLDIITYGRQASNVRKTALLCSLDRSKKVFYISLQWTGMS
ncbi:unnamed protein product [Candidula unifasciata]|uniref:tRNA-splicing endonuclease subunit SEN34 n=1 Tax=Candidula unifasciata TaxID=100452 RepID=A0A8S3Z5W9_9EUPU|nr:unnamed protein product [Candidula unifasciata]